jgi:serine/threonine-protein kinase
MAAVRSNPNQLGDYMLLDRIGVGGMAEVFLAERSGPHGFAKRVALKRILPGLAADQRFAEMFCDEARICAALNHPNIVQVLDFGEVAGELFMAMEFVEGLTVARLLRAASNAKKRIPMGAALYVAHEVLRGLEYAHDARDEAGRPLCLVHRDVSPGNVLLSAAGEVKLSDFGIVRSELVARRTQPGELKGKMGYMSPEQVAGVDVDRRSDLFTVGIVLTELLLLRPLFSGKNELEILTRINRVDLANIDRFGEGIPKSVRRVLEGVLQREREKRFATAGEFAAHLLEAARVEGLVVNGEQLSSWLAEADLLGTGQGPKAPPRPPSSSLSRAVTSSARRPESGARRAANGAANEVKVSLRSAAGGPLGTVSLTELMSRIATGRVPLDSVASRNGGPFVPLSSLSGASHLCARAAYRFGSGSLSRSSDAGGAPRPLRTVRFERRLLATHLFDAVSREANGLCAVRSGERSRRLFFREGVVEFVASTDSAELLGELAVSEGAITAVDLDECLIEAAESGVHLGEVLMMRGFLRASVVARILSEQRERRIASMFAWPDGVMVFEPGVDSGERLPITTNGGHSLITACARRGLGDEELAHLLAPLRNAPVTPTDSSLDPSVLGLTHPELRALRLVLPGGSCVSAHLRMVVDTARAERLSRGREALFAAFIGLSAGLLTMPGWQQSV